MHRRMRDRAAIKFNDRDHPARAEDVAITNRQPEGWGGSNGSPSIVSRIAIEGFELEAPV